MKIILSLLVLVAGISFADEPAKVASKDGTFVDASRSREIPYRVYYPDPPTQAYPVIVVSHGLGDSREGNSVLGRHLASRGYVVVHLQHHGSDSDVYAGKRDRRAIQKALAASLKQLTNARNRFLDVPFAVKELATLNGEDKDLKGHLDLEALGMAGHSYGAISTLVAAGEQVGPLARSLKVPGLRAGLLLSPSPPAAGQDAATVYRNVDIPLFHMTGTRDESPAIAPRAVSPAERVKPYQMLAIPDQYLLVLDDADHLTFAGSRLGTSEETRKDRDHMKAVLTGAVLFFDAYLKHQEPKKVALRNPYKQTLAKGDRFEFK